MDVITAIYNNNKYTLIEFDPKYTEEYEKLCKNKKNLLENINKIQWIKFV